MRDRSDRLLMPTFVAMFAQTQGIDSYQMNENQNKVTAAKIMHSGSVTMRPFPFLPIANNYLRPPRRIYIKPGSVRIRWHMTAATGVAQKIWWDGWAMLFHTRYVREYILCYVIVEHHCNTITHQQNCNMLPTIFPTSHTDIVKLVVPR